MAFVVMYDAAGVRRAAGKQASILNKIIETPGLSTIQVQEKLVEVLGHTPVQVFVGAIIGFVVGAAVTVISEIKGNMIVEVKDSRVAIGKDMANKIMV